MTITTDHKPNFTQPISIEPDEMSDFCRRFELAKINLSELEPISQQENSKHNLLGVRVGYDAFYASPRFMKSLMFMFDFTENIFSYFSPAKWYDIIMHDHRKCVLCDCLLGLILQYPEIFAQWCKFGTGSLYQPVFWQLTKV